MTMPSCGPSFRASREMAPKRFIPVLVMNTPALGKLGAQAGSRAWVSDPKFTTTRTWTQPQERRNARMGGEKEEGREDELLDEEEREVLLKERKERLPKSRASSRPL